MALTLLKRYYTQLKTFKNPFACPDCQSPVLPQYYEAHCKRHHRVQPFITCVWCRLESWPPKTKKDHAHHLIACAERFMYTSYSHRPPRLLALKHAHDQRYNYASVTLETLEHESVWPLSVAPLQSMSFQDDNLNLAAAYLLKYFELRESHEWFHVMVRVPALNSFLQALDEEDGLTNTLLFSCWCRGGAAQAPYKQHRHFVVVSPQNHFLQNVWDQVKVAKEDKRTHFLCKVCKPVKSPLHFVNILGYLSHTQSRCMFSATKQSKERNENHFYLYRTLPKDFRLPLVLLWDGGLESLLYQNAFQNISISNVSRHPFEFKKGTYQQKIKYFDGLERGMVVPVSMNFAPTEHRTAFFLHLMNGKKLYFQTSIINECLYEDTWLQKQVQGGNSFFEAVEEEFWTPRYKDMKVLNILLPVLEDHAQIQRKCEELQKDNELKRVETFYEEGKRFQQELIKDERIDQLLLENTTLKRDIVQFQKEIALLKKENYPTRERRGLPWSRQLPFCFPPTRISNRNCQTPSEKMNYRRVSL